jgi:hypothetical protein
VIPDTESLLALALVAFYVQDSALLLYADELVVTLAGRRWQLSLGNTELGGRYLFVPNPLLPGRVLFRAAWLEGGERRDAASPGELQVFIAHTRVLGVGCTALGVLLLVALPLALLQYPNTELLLALLVSAYAAIAFLLGYMVHFREALQLSRKEVASLVLDSLLCPPHAINLVRKLGLARGLDRDPLLFAKAELAKDEQALLRRALEGRLDLYGQADGASGIDGPAVRDNRQRIGELLP